MDIEGVAFLCFTADDTQVFGILSSKDHSIYTVKGKTNDVPDCHFHECCFDTIPRFYELCIQDSSGFTTEDIAIKHVMRTGGDNCSLTCDTTKSRLEFVTDQLLTGPKAEDYILRFFWPELLNKECYVCIGPMAVTIGDQENN